MTGVIASKNSWKYVRWLCGKSQMCRVTPHSAASVNAYRSSIEKSSEFCSIVRCLFDWRRGNLYEWELCTAPAVSNVRSLQISGRFVQSFRMKTAKAANHSASRRKCECMWQTSLCFLVEKRKTWRKRYSCTAYRSIDAFVDSVGCNQSRRKTAQFSTPRRKCERGPAWVESCDCRVVRRTFCLWRVNRILRDVTPRVFFLPPVVHRFIIVFALLESSPSVLFLLYDHLFSFYIHIL